MLDKMTIKFLGAAGTVTGSKYLVETSKKKLMVDCGVFQGLKELRLLNWAQPEFDPQTIDAVLLTHGHLDHTGYLARLVKLGFRGKIYGTGPTLKIAEIILKDSAKIQEEEAARANKDGYSKHHPAEAFYDLEDVEKTVPLFNPVAEGKWHVIEDDFRVRWPYNGHIIGSTSVEVEFHHKYVVFSGDIGRKKDLLLFPPKKPEKADVLLIESTYGGRIHGDEENIIPELERIINESVERGGSVFIPSFAVERTQLMMLMIWRLLKEKRIPKIPMIMDSPMGANVLHLFHYSRDWHKLDPEECDDMCSHFRVVSNFRETLALRKDEKPKIVIAGSGMMTGGRILNYMEARSGNSRDTLLFVGYQAEGTRGRKLLEGDKKIKVYGKWLPFNMHIEQIEGLSAHGDQKDLIDWLSEIKKQPEKLFIIHGETEQACALQQRIKEVYQWDSEIPKINQKVEL
ncbi:MBL fold metallo-hydrolase RNA specificity domain-containing protein [Ekhidna sp.]|jgi:metallo-beta-lactamase family protein|uniref:MBL fold metallo-hydrolase RNA specificity domain-containing protein n=2 Tax=Ekhidna sp. TaxID=2608089 RepID=UPI003CCB9F75